MFSSTVLLHLLLTLLQLLISASCHSCICILVQTRENIVLFGLTTRHVTHQYEKKLERVVKEPVRQGWAVFWEWSSNQSESDMNCWLITELQTFPRW